MAQSGKTPIIDKDRKIDTSDAFRPKTNPKMQSVIDHHVKQTQLHAAYNNKSAKTPEGKPDIGRNNFGKQQLSQFTLADRIKHKGGIAAGRIKTAATNFKNKLTGEGGSQGSPKATGSKQEDFDITGEPFAPKGGSKPPQTKAQGSGPMPGRNAQLPGGKPDPNKSKLEAKPTGPDSTDTKVSTKPTVKALTDLHDIMKASKNPSKGSVAPKTKPNPKGYTVKMSGTAGQSAKSKGYSVKVTGAKPGFSGYKPPKDNASNAPPPPKSTQSEQPKPEAQPKQPKPMETKPVGVKNALPETNEAHMGILSGIGKIIASQAPSSVKQVAQIASAKDKK